MRYKKVRRMLPTECAYLAGIIDGEGTVALSHKQKGARRHPVVSVCGTERTMLEYIMKIIGVGKITNKTKYAPHHKFSYTYQVTNQQALEVLRQTYQYLKTYKKNRARLLIKKYSSLTPRNGKYTPLLLRQRIHFEEIFLKVLPK